jgi:hypothetical protein
VALPKFEDFKAPWELDSAGNPIEADKQEVDPEKLKKHLYNVLSDKEKAQTARDAALTQVATVTTERDTLKTAAEQKSQEGLTELQKLQQSIEGLTKRAEQAEFDKTRIEVLTKSKIKPEAHGLLQGTTLAELEASAAQLVALGLVETASTGEGNNGDNGQGAGQGNPLDTTPRPRLNPGDPNPGAEGDGPSVDDFVKQYGGNTFPL